MSFPLVIEGRPVRTRGSGPLSATCVTAPVKPRQYVPSGWGTQGAVPPLPASATYSSPSDEKLRCLGLSKPDATTTGTGCADAPDTNNVSATTDTNKQADPDPVNTTTRNHEPSYLRRTQERRPARGFKNRVEQAGAVSDCDSWLGYAGRRQSSGEYRAREAGPASFTPDGILVLRRRYDHPPFERRVSWGASRTTAMHVSALDVLADADRRLVDDALPSAVADRRARPRQPFVRVRAAPPPPVAGRRRRQATTR